MKEMFEFPLRRTRQLVIEQLQQATKTQNVKIKVSRSLKLDTRELICR
jgi:hypothetical protein